MSKKNYSPLRHNGIMLTNGERKQQSNFTWHPFVPGLWIREVTDNVPLRHRRDGGWEGSERQSTQPLWMHLSLCDLMNNIPESGHRPANSC